MLQFPKDSRFICLWYFCFFMVLVFICRNHPLLVLKASTKDTGTLLGHYPIVRIRRGHDNRATHPRDADSEEDTQVRTNSKHTRSKCNSGSFKSTHPSPTVPKG